MKVFIFLVSCLLFFACQAEAVLEKTEQEQQQPASVFDIKPGMRLVFEFNRQGIPEELDVFFEAIEPDIRFRSNMPAQTDETILTVMTAAALDSAIKERLDFYNMHDTLTNEFMLIFPKKLYKSLIETDTCQYKPLGVNQQEMTFLVKIGEGKLPIIFDGMELEVDVIHVEERLWRNYEYWIMKNPDYPLIIRRRTDYIIELARVESGSDS